MNVHMGDWEWMPKAMREHMELVTERRREMDFWKLPRVLIWWILAIVNIYVKKPEEH